MTERVKYYGRQTTPEARAARDVAVRKHFAKYRSIALTAETFGLNRIKVGDIIKSAQLDAEAKQTQT